MRVFLLFLFVYIILTSIHYLGKPTTVTVSHLTTSSRQTTRIQRYYS